MDLLDQIYARGKAALAAQKESKRSPRPTPLLVQKEKPADAVVLCMIRSTCETCHSKHLYPNEHLLLRFGIMYHWSKHADGFAAYWRLPRETREIDTSVPCCENCFESTQLSAPANGADKEPPCPTPSTPPFTPEA